MGFNVKFKVMGLIQGITSLGVLCMWGDSYLLLSVMDENVGCVMLNWGEKKLA